VSLSVDFLKLIYFLKASLLNFLQLDMMQSLCELLFERIQLPGQVLDYLIVSIQQLSFVKFVLLRLRGPLLQEIIASLAQLEEELVQFLQSLILFLVRTLDIVGCLL
jgi:hypothetical protein